MDSRIEKVRDDIRKAEARRREVDEYIKTLKMRERQLCDEEILKTVRSMAGKGDVLDTLKEIKKKNEKSYSKAADSVGTKESAAFFDGKESEENS